MNQGFSVYCGIKVNRTQKQTQWASKERQTGQDSNPGVIYQPPFSVFLNRSPLGVPLGWDIRLIPFCRIGAGFKETALPFCLARSYPVRGKFSIISDQEPQSRSCREEFDKFDADDIASR